MSIKCVSENAGGVPTSVVYDKGTKSIYYVDFNGGSGDPCLFRYDTCKKKTYSAYIKGPPLGSPTYIIPIKSGKKLRKFAVGFESFVGEVCWNGKSNEAELVKELYR